VTSPVQTLLNRRRFQLLGIAAAGALAAPGMGLTGPRTGSAATPEASPAAYVPPTPTCEDDEEPTLAQAEGPYFTPDSPERTSLIEEGMGGEKLIVTGYVYSTACEPVGKALLDVWHADEKGVYDNEGYQCRGHLFTDEEGFFRLETILPGIYPGRTRHIHLKVQAPNGPVLTTQIYFPDEPENERDGLYDPELEMEMVTAEGEGEPLTGVYTFIVEPGS
jgi:protocatechuate 3,4-dioxygenase beta subunit